MITIYISEGSYTEEELKGFLEYLEVCKKRAEDLEKDMKKKLSDPSQSIGKYGPYPLFEMTLFPD